jgi:2-polyprenyl-3-methyl-5-hydroxy-6-metoxy-1,4-benzoquinol methylase
MNDANNSVGGGWNPKLYDDRHAFVWRHGASLVELLAPRPGERVLDLGCGTGHLSAISTPRTGGSCSRRRRARTGTVRASST